MLPKQPASPIAISAMALPRSLATSTATATKISLSPTTRVPICSTAIRAMATFAEEALEAAVALLESGDAQACMGAASADYDNDGDFDLYVTNFALDYNTLYQNDGRGFFKDVSATAGLIYPTWPFVGWGTGFADFDNDGWQDLFVANGHVYPQVEQLERGASYRQNNQLFLSAGNGRFTEATAAAGPGFAIEESSRGAVHSRLRQRWRYRHRRPQPRLDALAFAQRFTGQQPLSYRPRPRRTKATATGSVLSSPSKPALAPRSAKSALAAVFWLRMICALTSAWAENAWYNVSQYIGPVVRLTASPTFKRTASSRCARDRAFPPDPCEEFSRQFISSLCSAPCLCLALSPARL